MRIKGRRVKYRTDENIGRNILLLLVDLLLYVYIKPK